ncbi:PAS domain S-box protein [Sulfurimonas sp.]|uniref:PAS domain S-box protein n=1 Tax=Sulfurimonas sp. TaxID=2022749 RepID=UPI00356174D9
MKNKIQSIINTLHASTIITPILFAAVIIFTTLFFYIPYITEKNAIEMATKNSIISLEQIKLTRAYYVDAVVKDVKVYAPNLKFSYNHKGVNGTLPLPTTTIHNLSRIFSKNSGVKYNLYSAYPFAFKKERKLNQFQKEALKHTKESNDGMYIKKDFVDNKPVLRVAITDFMTDQACVDCHNTHPERTWEKGFWKLGDKRGVLEVITPLDEVLRSNIKARNNILIFISIIGIFLVAYLSYILVKREKQLLDANNELQEELKNILKDFDTNVIASTTDAEGNIIYASDLFCKISGYTRDELVGANHNIVRHKDTPKELYRDMWETIQNKKVWRGEIKNATKDGGFYWVDAMISPVINDKGEIIEYNSIRHDITSKKELESLNKSLKYRISEAITQAKEKEQHMLNQSKMAQMGEMLSMIAHQWRQPLTAISSTASALELKILMDDYDKKNLTSSIKDIQAYSQHLSLTINDFRNFFRDSKVVTQTTFEAIIDNTVQIVKTSLEAQDIILSIENNFTEQLYIYENEFKQVTLNLIKNAEDAIIESGVSDGFISIKTYKLDNNAIFEVSDNGRGINNEIMEKIFDPYFSTKDKKSGTGLGLYMSKTIIENHCLGSIECFNTEEGAMFRIIIDPNKLSLEN